LLLERGARRRVKTRREDGGSALKKDVADDVEMPRTVSEGWLDYHQRATGFGVRLEQLLEEHHMPLDPDGSRQPNCELAQNITN
jgi:hypothetical protein